MISLYAIKQKKKKNETPAQIIFYVTPRDTNPIQA